MKVYPANTSIAELRRMARRDAEDGGDDEPGAGVPNLLRGDAAKQAAAAGGPQPDEEGHGQQKGH